MKWEWKGEGERERERGREGRKEGRMNEWRERVERERDRRYRDEGERRGSSGKGVLGKIEGLWKRYYFNTNKWGLRIWIIEAIFV